MRFNQHAPDEIERLLCALRDDHVVGVRLHGARDANVASDCGAQSRMTG
jgi:hypothetical protein